MATESAQGDFGKPPCKDPVAYHLAMLRFELTAVGEPVSEGSQRVPHLLYIHCHCS